MIIADNHLALSPAGFGRQGATKVVVVLTDGAPNDWQTTDAAIDSFAIANPSSNFYGNGGYWLDAPLMKAAQMRLKKWDTHAVGIGLGTNYDFMDRLSRMGGTADGAGQSPRGSGNPVQYEQRLVDIFTEIISNPKVKLVD